jgi:hypothetical protein
VRCIQTLCAKINEGECIVLREEFDGGWSYLIWGRRPVQGCLGPIPEADAKEEALDAARAYLTASGRDRESLALCKLPWRVAIRTFTNDGPLGQDDMQLGTDPFGTQHGQTPLKVRKYANA